VYSGTVYCNPNSLERGLKCEVCSIFACPKQINYKMFLHDQGEARKGGRGGNSPITWLTNSPMVTPAATVIIRRAREKPLEYCSAELWYV